MLNIFKKDRSSAKKGKELKKILENPRNGRELIKQVLLSPEVNKKKKSSIEIDNIKFTVKELG